MPADAMPAFTRKGQSSIGAIIQTILGIVFVLPGACGGLFYLLSMISWVSSGFHYAKQDFSVLFLLIAVPLIWLSILLVGVLFRFLHWNRPPTASLVLSCIAIAAYLVAALAILTSKGMGENVDMTVIRIVGLVCAVLAATPSYLHWRNFR